MRDMLDSSSLCDTVVKDLFIGAIVSQRTERQGAQRLEFIFSIRYWPFVSS